jgi:hypothetical protein
VVIDENKISTFSTHAHWRLVTPVLQVSQAAAINSLRMANAILAPTSPA